MRLPVVNLQPAICISATWHDRHVSPRQPFHGFSYAALGIAVVAVSSSGPLIAYAAAPALAIAFWRNAMAVGLQAPWAVLRRRELVALTRRPHRREGLFSVLAGVALAGHFATWVPSAKLTSVATATALVAQALAGEEIGTWFEPAIDEEDASGRHADPSVAPVS